MKPRVMVRVLIVDTEEARVQRLRSAFAAAKHQILHARDPAEVKDLASEAFDAVVVAVRAPLTHYLEMIRALKSRVNEPLVLAVFAGGQLPADYALAAAQIYGADAILYQPHSITELVNAMAAMFGSC